MQNYISLLFILPLRNPCHQQHHSGADSSGEVGVDAVNTGLGQQGSGSGKHGGKKCIDEPHKKDLLVSYLAKGELLHKLAQQDGQEYGRHHVQKLQLGDAQQIAADAQDQQGTHEGDLVDHHLRQQGGLPARPAG